MCQNVDLVGVAGKKQAKRVLKIVARRCCAVVVVDILGEAPRAMPR
jgi:hypothetical protein